MEYFFDSDTPSWSFNDKSFSELQSYVIDERMENNIYHQRSFTFESEPSRTFCDEPTYINISSAQQFNILHMPFHFGDRFKGLFLFLRETNTCKYAITSLQQDLEKLLNNHSTFDLATANDEQFVTDIAIFAKMIDNRLRQIKKLSEEQFSVISKKLTKLEKKQRKRSNFVHSLGELTRRFFMRKRNVKFNR